MLLKNMHNSRNRCPLCGGRKEAGFTTFTADLKEMIVVIREVPATVCSLCGNEWLSDDVAGQIESIVQDAKDKKHLFEVTVFSSHSEEEAQALSA
ncbi:MAG: type II toxin-antitoxin system MqsA family antitoxin [Desulfococcaceae bacterium]|nr:type II toxin-antitoxin system MqsA family antitoxin [Desulfococcaceae bacterium]